MKENVYEQNQHQPYWKRLYNSLGLWIFLYLIIITSGFYIIAVDFSFEPHQQMKPQLIKASKSLTNPADASSKINKQNSISTSKSVFSDDKRLQAIVKE